MSRPPRLIAEAISKLDKAGVTLSARASFILSLRDLMTKRSTKMPRITPDEMRTWADVLATIAEQLEEIRSGDASLNASAIDQIQDLIQDQRESPKKEFKQRVEEFLREEEEEYEEEEEEEEEAPERSPAKRKPGVNHDDIVVGRFLAMSSSSDDDRSPKSRTRTETSPMRMSQPLSQQIESSPKYINLDVLDDDQSPPRVSRSPRESPSFMRMDPDEPPSDDYSDASLDPETGLLTVKMSREDYDIVRILKAKKMGKGEVPGFLSIENGGTSDSETESESSDVCRRCRRKERRHRRHRHHKHERRHRREYSTSSTEDEEPRRKKKTVLSSKKPTPVRLIVAKGAGEGPRSPTSPEEKPVGAFFVIPEERKKSPPRSKSPPKVIPARLLISPSKKAAREAAQASPKPAPKASPKPSPKPVQKASPPANREVESFRKVGDALKARGNVKATREAVHPVRKPQKPVVVDDLSDDFVVDELIDANN